MRVLNTAQMREADRITIEEIGIPSIVLMENAGRQVVAAMEAALEDFATSKVGVLAGRGNNGGDGFVVARTLTAHGLEVLVVAVGSLAEIRGDARANLDVLGRIGVSLLEGTNEQEWELHSSSLWGCDVLVDALFGTGLKEALSGLHQTVVADVNASGIRVVAVDVPSGVSCDSAELPGGAIQASVTVALGAPKLPHLLPPAETHVGELVVVDIGIPEPVIDSIDGPVIEVLTREAARAMVAPRDPQSHKGDYGRVLIVGGSLGKTGAAHLTAWAALRSGAGLVTVATPRDCLPIIAAMQAEYMTLAIDDAGGEEALSTLLAQRADVIAVGPGFGIGAVQREIVFGLLERCGVPLVFDADALNLCAEEPERLRGRDGLDIVITPHPGEMARLLGTSLEYVQGHRLEVARDLAVTRKLHVVLKGYRTLVATPEGRVSINMTGNPGMATGGAGDVLTGMVAAWLGQLLDADAASRLAVYLHGLAGDLAEADEGAVAMTAGDIVSHLGDAVLELTSERRVERS